MRNFLIFFQIISLLYFSLFSPRIILAKNDLSPIINISDSSAKIIVSRTNFKKNKDERIPLLKEYLNNYKSPLTDYSEFIVKTSDKYDIPWTLIVSIAGVESGFCRKIPLNSFNCWGWDNGKKYFLNYEDAIETIIVSLKINYIDNGRITPEQIAPVYAPPSQTWAKKVRYFLQSIENFRYSRPPNLQINI